MKINLGQKIIDKIRGKKHKNNINNQIEASVNNLIEYINNINVHSLKDCINVYDHDYDFYTLQLSKLFDAIVKKFDISIIHKNIFDYKLYIKSNELLSKRIFALNYPVDSYPELCLFKKFNKHFNVTFDIGANRGLSACFFAKISDKVYAFEPMLDLVERFKKNIEINNYSNIKIIEKAVSNCCKKDKFCVYESDGHGSLLHHDQSKFIKEVDVDVITLDSFCRENNIDHIDMLSVDVEGFELQVFEGATNLLKNLSIDIIMFEVVKGYLSQDKIDNLFKYLENFGYEIFNLKLEKINSSNLIFHQDLLAMPKGKKDILFNTI